MNDRNRCKTCRKEMASPAFRPFCSKRCADVDLGRWLKGGYVIPGREGEAGTPANDTGDDKTQPDS